MIRTVNIVLALLKGNTGDRVLQFLVNARDLILYEWNTGDRVLLSLVNHLYFNVYDWNTVIGSIPTHDQNSQ